MRTKVTNTKVEKGTARLAVDNGTAADALCETATLALKRANDLLRPPAPNTLAGLSDRDQAAAAYIMAASRAFEVALAIR